MFDPISIGKTAIEPIGKIVSCLQKRHEESEEQDVLDGLRMASANGGAKALRPPVGSKEDRLYQRMASKGKLVKLPGAGYVLPEYCRIKEAYGNPY